MSHKLSLYHKYDKAKSKVPHLFENILNVSVCKNNQIYTLKSVKIEPSLSFIIVDVQRGNTMYNTYSGKLVSHWEMIIYNKPKINYSQIIGNSTESLTSDQNYKIFVWICYISIIFGILYYFINSI